MTSLYEPLFRHVLFPAYESVLRGRKTLTYLREYERQQWLDPEQIDALQWQKLQRLLRHCWEHVPYYRQTWTALGITAAEDIRDRAHFARLPVLDKPTIRANFERLIADGHRSQLLYKTTGGSTGEPLKFGYTRESYERRVAVMWRGYGWAGAKPGKRTFYLWGGSLASSLNLTMMKARMYDAAFNRRVENSFLMNEVDLERNLARLDSFRPEIIVGYTGMLMRMAEWLQRTGRRVHRASAILTAAEPLHEFQRPIIEAAFGAPVFNSYGCREFMLIAAECGCREGLHVNQDHLLVQCGRALSADPDDRSREAVITDLHNYGMPLLRYLNGDVITPMPGACSCGRGLERIARIEGRTLDVIYSSDGKILHSGYVTYLFLQIGGIDRFQIVQRARDRLDVYLVRGIDFSDGVLDYLRTELGKAVGDSIAMEFHFVDAIALTASGKYRVMVSEID